MAESAALQEIAGSVSEFSKAIYNILRQTEGNVFVSPLSIEIVLALAHAGAGGRTAEQILTGLRLPSDVSKVHDGMETLLQKLVSNENITLELANSIFVQQNYHIKQHFLDVGKKVFKAHVQELDFADSRNSLNIVNKWVESKTNEKIKDLLPDGSVDADTRAVLVNAVYFKGNWANKFDKAATYKGPFHISNTETKEVDFMKITKHFRMSENDELNSIILELPYAGDEVSMVILLPREKDGLKQLEEKLPNVNLNELFTKLHKREVVLSLPRFKLEQTIDLEQVLQALGMTEMFSQKLADFSNMAEDKLYVSKAVQKSFIEVNEEGSEAAAATGVVITLESIPRSLRVDRPFYFALRHVKTDSIVFMGRVSKP